jgi:hypothetical protein
MGLTHPQKGKKMSDSIIELYREDGATHHDVHLTVKDDGAVHLSAYDLGEAPERVWGHDDYEYWVDVPPTEVQKLLFVLLKEKYLGRTSAVDEFTKFCVENGIENKWQSYP